VEDEPTLERLAVLGCDSHSIQGFVISLPLPTDWALRLSGAFETLDGVSMVSVSLPGRY